MSSIENGLTQTKNVHIEFDSAATAAIAIELSGTILHGAPIMVRLQPKVARPTRPGVHAHAAGQLIALIYGQVSFAAGQPGIAMGNLPAGVTAGMVHAAGNYAGTVGGMHVGGMRMDGVADGQVLSGAVSNPKNYYSGLASLLVSGGGAHLGTVAADAAAINALNENKPQGRFAQGMNFPTCRREQLEFEA